MFKWLFSISITEAWNNIQELRKVQKEVSQGEYEYLTYMQTRSTYITKMLYAQLVRMAISLVRDAVVLALLVKLFLL